MTRARSSAGSLSAHRLTQSFSSFMLGRVDSPTDSNKGLSLDRRQFDNMHGRKSSFGSMPNTPLKPPSGASPSSPISPPSQPGSLVGTKAAAIEVLMERSLESKSAPSEDGTDVEEAVVPFDGLGDISLISPTARSVSNKETKEAKGGITQHDEGAARTEAVDVEQGSNVSTT